MKDPGIAGKKLSHVDEAGKARMVDVSAKEKVRRTARARGEIIMAPETIELVKSNGLAKGEVLAVARVAGIMAAKRTADIIPLCHNIEIEHVDVIFRVLEDRIEIESLAICTDKTGIEMEALTAVTVAALGIYDMCKAVDKGMIIGNVSLIEKTKTKIMKDPES